MQAGAGCKTVGSAYVGSNPTPATTRENGPLAAETWPGGPFPSCHGMYQPVSLRAGALRCPRTYSGRRPGRQDSRCAPSAFPRTATDGPRRRAFPGLMCTAEPGVYPLCPAARFGVGTAIAWRYAPRPRHCWPPEPPGSWRQALDQAKKAGHTWLVMSGSDRGQRRTLARSTATWAHTTPESRRSWVTPTPLRSPPRVGISHSFVTD